MEKYVWSVSRLIETAHQLFQEERSRKRLDGWFLAKEMEYEHRSEDEAYSEEIRSANRLRRVAEELPLSLSEHNIFAGTQRDAFARSYALINPAFEVETFSGYCDPTAVYDDIEPNDVLTKERIERVRAYQGQSDYVRELSAAYQQAEPYTKEVVYFFEQVTGHLIPDFRAVLRCGVDGMLEQLNGRESEMSQAMRTALSSVPILAERYAALAEEQMKTATTERRKELERMRSTLQKVAHHGAEDLYEAMQLFLLLWQLMCLEQAPNPFAFSVGNADRIFEPFCGDCDRATASGLFCHFLVFFNVADRSWAISQNILVGGRDVDGNDLTSETTYALLDAYYEMNLPQPILSVKLHRNTPEELYRSLGRFFFTPGMLTPSLFHDDAVFSVLERAGIERDDLPDYSVAGCQEPLIMGRDNGNTTNSWLNLPKILELTLTGGRSILTGEQLVELEKAELSSLREVFYRNVERVVSAMANSANQATAALSHLRVPFLSAFMGGMETDADLRDVAKQGTKYNGSGCLIHGLGVLTDSLAAVEHLCKEKPEIADELIDALKHNFEGYETLRKTLLSYPKYGNHIAEVDDIATEVANRVSDIVRNAKNNWGNPFRPDFSSPSTHLLYGYWVGATPDGRKAREMLSYGIDPLYGEASGGLGFRILSAMELPFEKFCGGYASHFGVDPKYFRAESMENKGIEFRDKIVRPLFFNPLNEGVAPFYLYVNVTTPEMLRKVLADPKKYAPSGVYIMRIHGTFVNFLDLSPAIQQDIIQRLDLKSTTLEC